MKCTTPYCKNQAATDRTVCHTCKSKAHRRKHLMRYAYDTLKANASRRGVLFNLTFNEFEMFCRETKYHLGKGRTKVSFTVDRMENDKGYEIGNIRVLSKSENSSKGTKSLIYDWETGHAVYL